MLSVTQLMPWLVATSGSVRTSKMQDHDINVLNTSAPLFSDIRRDIVARLLIETDLDSNQLNQFIPSNDKTPFTSLDLAPSYNSGGSTQLGVNSYQRKIAKINDDFSLLKDIMILLQIDKVVDDDVISLFASDHNLMKFLHGSQINHTNVAQFKRAIVDTITLFFHDRNTSEHTCITMRNILSVMGHQIVSTVFAKDLSRAIAIVTHKNRRNQNIFASESILDTLLYLFNVVRKNDHYSMVLTKNIVQAISNITFNQKGKRIFNTNEVRAILDVVECNTHKNIVHGNIRKIRENLSSLPPSLSFR